jgi:hypothetical protein
MKNYAFGEEGAAKKEISTGRAIAYSCCLLVLCVMLALLQTSGITVFGAVPDALLALVCAAGFVMSAGFGAACGVLAAMLVSILGGSGFTLVPFVYVLCGFFSGALKNKVLSSNFPSFLVFGAMAGFVREIFTLIYYGLISEEIDVGLIISDVLVGEYFAYILCLVPIYFAVLGVYLLFKGKDEVSHTVR